MIRKIALASLNFITIQSGHLPVNADEDIGDDEDLGGNFIDEDNGLLDDSSPFTYFAPRRNWQDFDSNEYENISQDMTNPRNVLMYDIETGDMAENYAQCGFYGCNDMNKVPYTSNPFGPANALDGRTHNEGTAFQNFHNYPDANYFDANSADDGQNSGLFRGYLWWDNEDEFLFQNAWIADIQNNPTVEFVKIWPAFNWISPFYDINMAGLRVFVNEVECLPIEYYDLDRVRQWVCARLLPRKSV